MSVLDKVKTPLDAYITRQGKTVHVFGDIFPAVGGGFHVMGDVILFTRNDPDYVQVAESIFTEVNSYDIRADDPYDTKMVTVTGGLNLTEDEIRKYIL